MGQVAKGIHGSLLNHIFTASGYTPPAGIYASLHIGDPGETGANEASYPGYTGSVRQLAVFTTAAASRSVTHDNSDLVFPMATSGSQLITHYGLWSASTVGAGTFIGGGSLVSSMLVTGGNIPIINGGEIVLTWNAGSSTGMSNYLANKLLDFLFRNQAFTRPTIQLGLFTTTCSDSAVGTECPGANYARIAVSAWNSAAYGASDAYTANTNEALFATPSDGSWGTVVALAIFDSVTTNMLFYGNDVVDLPVVASVAVKAVAGAMVVTLT